MLIVEILQGEPQLFRTRPTDIDLRLPQKGESANTIHPGFNPLPTPEIKHSDVNLPKMYIDWNQGYPSDEQSVTQVLAPWPQKGVNIQPHDAPDPRHRRGGVANDNYRRGEVLIK